MGINLIWVCERHRRYHYSMRGEEPQDFQRMARQTLECPGSCLRDGLIRARRDADFDHGPYEPFWPELALEGES